MRKLLGNPNFGGEVASYRDREWRRDTYWAATTCRGTFYVAVFIEAPRLHACHLGGAHIYMWYTGMNGTRVLYTAVSY